MPAHTEVTPLRVLFVCTANVCRSPYMEATARTMLPCGGVVFTSAGTRGLEEEQMEPEMAACLPEAAAGFAERFRSRPLRRDLLDAADLVLTAEVAHRATLLAERPALFRKVLTLGQAATAMGRIEAGPPPGQLIERLVQARGAADPALDVPDPYGRGPGAAVFAASTIDGLLEAIVPGLAAVEA
jgi:sulfate adenylyltransferase